MTEETYYHDFKNDEFADKYIFNKKTSGYFIEIGACNGIDLSQCYFFEKFRNWDGIAVEPQKRFRNDVINNRKQPCFNCIGNEKKVVNFTESVNYGLSGVTHIQEAHENFENYKVEWRNEGYTQYSVNMITLLDLMEDYGCPEYIDYIGMDCEGSEYNIIDHYFKNNTKYKIKFMCIEVGRNDIVELLLQNNYIEINNPILPDWNCTKVVWERYFIHNSEIPTIDPNLVKT